MSAPQADPKFLQLRQQYIQGLPHRIQQIRTAWSRLQHVSWDPKILTLMTHAVHKLTGSGSTFHLPDITLHAAELEALLERQQQQHAAGPTARQEITTALTALDQSIQQILDRHRSSDNAAAKAKAAPEPGAPFHIAVIEDDAQQAARIELALTEQGYTVHTFADPEAYAGETRDWVYQLILLDVTFPDGSLEGLAWLERMKGHIGTQIPVAIMSERSDMVARMRALQAGADIFLTKPLDLSFLARRIHQLHEKANNVCPRVLWVDDDKDLLAYYQSLLTNQGYEVDSLSQPVRLLERIEHFQPDVIVLDYQMPGSNGVQLARVLRQDPRYMTIPILFVSATDELQAEHNQNSIVGNAFFQKPLDEEAFLQSLQTHVVRAQLISARIDLLSQRHEAAGLQNQDYFINRLEARLATLETDPPENELYLIQLGIDNEEYLKARHGTRAMINMASCMERYLAEYRTIGGVGCNMGGGSFLALLEAPAAQTGEEALKTFQRDLNNHAWPLDSASKPVTISVGAMHLSHAMDVDLVLAQVESACAKAIKAGGNRVEWNKTQEQPNHAGLTDHLKELVQAKAFTLHYQPVMNMESEETLFEALIRLIDDDHAVYMPSQFLPWLPAGTRGNFYELDRWVIEHAVDNLVKLEGKAAASHSVIIKLSSPLAEIERMQPFITNVIRSSRVKGKRRIFLAFSNATVLKDIPRAQKVFESLQALGCGIIIEHVGAESNIVQVLKDVGPVDYIKLSPELGARTAQSPALDKLLNDLTTHLGSTLPIMVTGVEDAKVLSKFWERGIRFFQGYFIQKPGMSMNTIMASDTADRS